VSEAKGYICDRCQKFEVSTTLPDGWMRLCIQAKVPRPEGTFASPVRATDVTGDCLDLCSNACLAVLAVERARAADEKTPGIYTREVKETTRKQRSDAGVKRK
jgi:hypothetical protein